MTRVLALDPAMACGYAWTADGELHADQAGTWLLNGGKKPYSASPLRRLGMLETLLNQYTPDAVYWEAPGGHQNVSAGAWAYILDRHIENWCHRHGPVQYASLRPTQLKHFATGGGVADKAAMLAAAMKRWPKQKKHLRKLDDNGVDALWVLAWGLEQNGDG